MPEHRLTELDSGLRIVTEVMPSVRSAALGFFVGAGSRGETEAEAGLSHFLEHMLFRGTPRYGSTEIDQLFDGMGAELNAGTDKEGTTVYARMLDQHLPVAFDVMADMVWRPAFNDVDPERQVVLEEIAMYEDDPQDIVFDVLGRAVYGEHPLGRPIIGRAPVIRDTPVEEIAAFHARRYRPGSIVIAAAGSVDHDQIVELATSTLELRDVDPAPPLLPAPDAPRSTLQFQRKDTEQVHVCLGAIGLPAARRPPLRPARARRHLRRPVLVTAVPGRARGARARLLRLLVHRPVHRHGRDRALRRHAAGQPGRGDGDRRRRARPPARARASPRRSSSGRARTSRRGSCSGSSRRGRA